MENRYTQINTTWIFKVITKITKYKKLREELLEELRNYIGFSETQLSDILFDNIEKQSTRVCDFCEKTFTTPYNCVLHLLTNHRIRMARDRLYNRIDEIIFDGILYFKL